MRRLSNKRGGVNELEIQLQIYGTYLIGLPLTNALPLSVIFAPSAMPAPKLILNAHLSKASVHSATPGKGDAGRQRRQLQQWYIAGLGAKRSVRYRQLGR